MEQITIGYLSWKRYEIFNQTLNSHKNNGLFDLIIPQNRIIFFQEICDTDIYLAKKFDCNYIGNRENIGILNAFIELVENCKTEYFIFCENDWYLNEMKNITEDILNDCISIFKQDKANIIKLRHRKNPGNPLYSKNIFSYNNCMDFPYKLESLSWLNVPNVTYNNILDEFNSNYKWYITSLLHQRWSNNIFICKINDIKNILIPLIKLIKNNDNYKGLEDILINYNNFLGLNITQDTIINKYATSIILAAGEGLFTHKDFVR
jgi:hypothetical protein